MRREKDIIIISLLMGLLIYVDLRLTFKNIVNPFVMPIIIISIYIIIRVTVYFNDKIKEKKND